MLPAATFAREQKTTIAEEMRFAGVFDPGFRRVAEQHPWLRGCGVPDDEIEPRLRAILHVRIYPFAIGEPAEAGDQRIVRLVAAEVEKRNRGVRRGGDAELHRWVRVAGLRVRIHLRTTGGGCRFGQRELLHVRVVEPHENNRGPVRVPPKGAACAVENFFFVNPVAAAVEDVATAIIGECCLDFRFEVQQVQVPFSD